MHLHNNFTKNFFEKIFGAFFAFTFLVNFVFADPSISVTPATQTVNYGSKATVKIVTTNADNCVVSGGNYNNSKVIINGNILLSPTQTVTYTFKCTDVNGVSASTVSIVNVPNAPVTQPSTSPQTTPTSPATNPSTNPSASPTGSPASTASPYGTGNIQQEANSICTAYSGYQSVYGNPVAGGGSSVPVDLTDLKPYLINIQQNSGLTANEMRQADMIRFCRELPNMAAASNKLALDSAKQLKKIADDCTADEPCYLQRAYNKDIQDEVTRAQAYPVYGPDIARLVLNLNISTSNDDPVYDATQVQKCASIRAQGLMTTDCIMVPTKGDIELQAVYAAKNRVGKNQSGISAQFQNGNGVIGSKTCTHSKSGADPSTLKWTDDDCDTYKLQPALINQEILKQVTALPYTQAYSPANVLGSDQSINNISTRILKGNLVDPNVSSNFGSVTNGGTDPNGGGITNGTDMTSVTPNYKKILSNIGVITTLYDVANAYYSSSTSACVKIPATTRSGTILKIAAAKKTYTDYATDLTNKWNAAVAKPNENHLDLVTKINFDLKDTYNQTLINSVYTAVKALLQTCADVANGNTPST